MIVHGELLGFGIVIADNSCEKLKIFVNSDQEVFGDEFADDELPVNTVFRSDN